MTPSNANEALYSDILSKHIVDKEYAAFCGVFEKWCKVYYVSDLLSDLLESDDVRQWLVAESCRLDGCRHLEDWLLQQPSSVLAQHLIEGVPYHYDTDPQEFEAVRYTLKPLYNLFFTRDASSSLYGEVLINAMSFAVRERESLIYRAIFDQQFGAKTFSAKDWDGSARTEGGDVQVGGPDLLCIGQGIRTNAKGVAFLAHKYAKERGRFNVLVQELPHQPESFIHLDMVHTFLGSHQVMAYQPMIEKTGIFAGKATTLLSCDNGKVSAREYPNMLAGLKACGMDMEPVYCGGPDNWYQEREQWHSGANFFALGDGKVIGYERNVRTIEALSKAGFAVLPAAEVCSGRVRMDDYEKFVVTFEASELPRGGGGARCMTMPVSRDRIVMGE